MSTSRFCRLFGLIVASSLVALASPTPRARAAVLTWNANTGASSPQDGGGTWNVSGSNWWNGGSNTLWPNTGSDTAVFGAANGSAGTVTVSGTVLTNQIVFNPPGSGNYLLTGGIVKLNGTTPTFTANVYAIMGCVISGTGGLTKSGSGDLVFTGSESYTGGTTVTAGTLQIGGANNVLPSGTPVSVSSGATLLYSTSSSETINNNTSGTGTWTFAAGTPTTNYTLTGTNNSGFSGTMNINSGQLSLTASSGASPSSSSVINVADGATLALGGGTLNSNLTISGLGLGNSGAIHFQQGKATIEGNVTLVANSMIFGQTASNGDTVAGNISGPYQLQLQTGTIALTGSNTYGSTLISGASVYTDAPSALSSGTLVMSSGSLVMNGNSFSVSSLSGSGGQILNTNASSVATLTVGSDNSSTTFSGTLADGGAASLALTKIGAGSVTLSGSNSFSGATTISAGTLQVNSPQALQNTPVNVSGGVLLIGGVNIPISSLSGGGSTVLNSGTISLGGNNASSSYTGAISGAGGFVKSGAGAVTLSGASNFVGSSALMNGTLVLANTAGFALGSSTLTLNGGELASAPGTGGATSGAVIAGNAGHSISPGGDGTVGSLGVGGLTINDLSTLRFDIISTSNLDQISDSGSFAFAGPGTANVLVPASLSNGTYKLIGYGSDSSISVSNLSLGIIGGGSVPSNYQLNLTPLELDLDVSAGTNVNNSVLAASTTAVAFGRVMLNNIPTANVAISLSSGTSQTGFSVSASGGATAVASGNGPGAVPPSGNVAIGLLNATGSYSASVYVQNSGDSGSGPSSAGPGLGAAQSPIPISVTGNVVANRVVTSTSAAFGLIHLGQSVSQPIILSTTGSDSQYTRVTVPNGSDANGLSVSGGLNPVFNSPPVTDTRILGGTPNKAGIINGAVILATSGEGLSGESPISVSVTYSVPVFSGSANWNGTAGSSWGTAANWNDQLTPAINAAPGTFAGFSDAATIDDSSSNRTITLDGASPHLFSLTVSDTTGNGCTIAQGSGGTLNLDGGAGTATVSVLSGTHTITAPIALDTPTAIASNGGTLLLNTTITGSGALIVTGSGQLTLPGADTLSSSGGITVAQGTLATPLGISHAGGAIAVAGGATFTAGGLVKRAVTGTGTVTASSELIIGTSTQSGQFNQGGAPGIGGTLNIGGNTVVILSADAAILGSQTNLGPGGSLLLNSAQLGNPASVDATKVLTATGDAMISGNFINNGVVNGPTGSGQELTFTQFVKGAGSTTGNVEYQASYRPSNSPDAVSVQNVLFDSTSTLIMELDGTTPGTGYDQLDISGMATLNGALDVELLNGFSLSDGESFELFNGTTTGSFEQITLPALSSGLSWDTSNLYTDGTISVVPEPSTLALLGVGVIGLVGLAWRRRKLPRLTKTMVRGFLAAALVASAVSAKADVFNMGGTISGGTWTGLASLQFVTVGDPGNLPDPTTGYGAVPSTFYMGKYDVTLGQYVRFLNAVAATDPYGCYNSLMAGYLRIFPFGISVSGSAGSYTYSVYGSNPQAANMPVYAVS